MGLGRVVHGFRSIARNGKRRQETIAFVLSGGGVLGSVQVGQLDALISSGVVPDVLVGTSVGALNAAAVAADPTIAGVHALRDTWLSLRSEDLFPGNRVQQAWQFLRRGDHLFPNDGIRRLVERVPARTFDELRAPVWVGATNLRTGKQHWFNTGALEPALLASTALPGIFPPVPVDGEVYVDGGVVNNVPIAKAVELGATRIYVLTCGGPVHAQRPIRRPIDVLLQAVSHSRAAHVEVEVERYRPHATIEVLPTFDTSQIRFNDMSQTRVLMARARDLARDWLAEPAAAHAHA